MSDLYLHIGTTKTGTSTLQRFFSNHRSFLGDHRVIYPKAGIYKISHLNLYNAVIKSLTSEPHGFSKQLMNIKGRIMDEFNGSDADSILLSCERFFANTTPEIVTFLVDLFHNFKLKVIVYLRRQDIWLQSIYKEQMKSSNPSMRYRIEQFLETDYAKKSTDYYSILSIWADQIGKENIIVRVYERGQIKDDLVSDFLDIFGLPPVSGEFVKSTNLGLTASQTEVVRLLKFLQISPDEREILHNWLYSNFIYTSKQNPDFFNSYSLIPFEQAKNILSRHEKGNESIAKEFLSRTNGQLFYEKLKKATDQKDSLYLHPELFSKIADAKLLSFILYLLMQINKMNVNRNKEINKKFDRMEKKLDHLANLISKGS